MRDILLFTGLSTSGKSTLANQINQAGYFEIISERGILHNLAVEHGFKRTRDWLANAGVTALLEAARTATVQLIEAIQREGIIIDGSYDRELPGYLRGAFPQAQLTIILVALDPRIREDRMKARLGRSLQEAREELSLINGFKLAAGIEEVIRQADISVDNSGMLEESVQVLKEALEIRGVAIFGDKERY